MTTIERRVSELETARADYLAPLVILIAGERTDEQRRAIEEAESMGRLVLLVSFVGSTS